jgi:hypothetical protein
MGVVLGEVPHPQQSMQRARRLVAMHLAELGNAQRQIAIALQPMLEDLHVTGTVHRLAAIDPLVRSLGDVHVLGELLPVAGLLPQGAVEHVG